MNRIYKSIYNRALGAWVAVGENVRSHGKANGVIRRSLAALAIGSLLNTAPALAAPVMNNGTGTNSLTISPNPANPATASGEDDIAVGRGSKADSSNHGQYKRGAIAIGRDSQSLNKETVAIGYKANAALSQGIAIGAETKAVGDQSTALGNNVVAQGNSSVAIGGDDLDTVSTGATGLNSSTTATNYKNLTGDDLVDRRNQYRATTTGDAAVAVGVQSQASGNLSTAFGTKTTASGLAATALGVGANASKDNAVALGSGSTTGTDATSVKTATIAGITYGSDTDPNKAFAGSASVEKGDQVSVGSAGYERQIKHVAPGKIAADSTDAINGSQLHAVAEQIGANKTHYYSVKGNAPTDGNYNNDGATAANALAAGVAAAASGPSAVAVGHKAQATSPHSIALGQGTNTGESQFGIAIGSESKLGGTGKNTSIAIGRRSEATALDSIAMGRQNQAAADGAIAIGTQNNLQGIASIGVGQNVSVQDRDGIAIGNRAAANAGENNTAIGSYSSANVGWSTAVGTRAYTNGNGAVALGTMASGGGQRATAVGSFSYAKGLTSTAVGYNTIATDSASSSTALGTGTVVSGKSSGAWSSAPHGNPGNFDKTSRSYVGGTGNYAIGNKNIVGGQTTDSVVFGNNIKLGATGANLTSTDPAGRGNSIATRNETVTYTGEQALKDAVAIGNSANVKASTATAVGAYAEVQNQYGVAIGGGDNANARTVAKGAKSVAVGYKSNADADNAIAIGTNATVEAGTATADSGTVTGVGSVSVGADSSARGTNAAAFGQKAEALGQNSLAAGQDSHATGKSSVALGDGARSSKDSATAVGVYANASGAGATSLGASSKADQWGTTAVGLEAKATGNSSATAVGHKAEATGSAAVAVGKDNRVSGNGSGALGSGNTVGQANSFVLGKDVTTSQANSVVLGNASTDRAATAETQATVNGITYNSFAGVGNAANGVVSVGKDGGERQLINVAAGKISKDSTDAINGSQLYLTQEALGNLGKTTVKTLGGNAAMDNKGNITMTNIGDTGENTVHDAIKSVNAGWNFQVNGSPAQNVKPKDTVNFKDGNNIAITNNGKEITIATKPNLTADSLTINNGPVINGSGINMNSKPITGLAAGTANDHAVNLGQLNNAVNTINNNVAAAKTEVVGGTNIASIGQSTGGQNQTIYTINADGTTVSAGSNLVSVTPGTKNTTTNITDYQVDLSAGAKASLSKADSSVQDVVSVNPNLTANKDANGKVTLDFSTDPNFTSVKTGDSTMNNDGLTINGGPSVTKNGIDAGNETISNVAPGVAGTDAVNVNQLNAAKTHYYSVNDNGTPVANHDNTGATGTNALAAGTSASAAGNGAVAVGNSATAGAENTLASGNGAKASAAGGVALGANATADRAAISGASTSATASASANQVYANDNAETADKNAILATVSGSQGAVSVGQDGQTRQIVNVAAGSNDSDAVNVSQLKAVAKVARGSTTNVTNTTNVYHTTIVEDNTTVSAGQGIRINRSGKNYQVGLADNVSVNSLQAGNTVVDGNGVSVAGTNYVGANGLNAGGRTISNVAPGRIAPDSTDAVNGAQLHRLYDDLKHKDAGIASAMASANLPQVYLPGKNMVGLGVAHYNSQNAIAVGMSALSDNGKWVLKGSVNANSKKVGVGAGIGYQW